MQSLNLLQSSRKCRERPRNCSSFFANKRRDLTLTSPKGLRVLAVPAKCAIPAVLASSAGANAETWLRPFQQYIDLHFRRGEASSPPCADKSYLEDTSFIPQPDAKTLRRRELNFRKKGNFCILTGPMWIAKSHWRGVGGLYFCLLRRIFPRKKPFLGKSFRDACKIGGNCLLKGVYQKASSLRRCIFIIFVYYISFFPRFLWGPRERVLRFRATNPFRFLSRFKENGRRKRKILLSVRFTLFSLLYPTVVTSHCNFDLLNVRVHECYLTRFKRTRAVPHLFTRFCSSKFAQRWVPSFFFLFNFY